MNKERYRKFLESDKFLKWWSDRLRVKENKLLDYNTGKPMTLEKRLLHERPSLEDMSKLAIFLNLTVSILNVPAKVTGEDQWVCVLRNKNSNEVMDVSTSFTESIEVSFLKWLFGDDIENEVA